MACGVTLGLRTQAPAATVAEKISKPAAVVSTPKPAPKPVTYVVRNGDNDWAVAAKHFISVAQLHAANPGIEWRHLQIGHELAIPGAGTQPPAAVATKAPAVRKPSAKGSYTVKSGENDWIIASRLGITRQALYAMNPGVKWSKLPIGAKLAVPSNAVVTAAASKVIRSRNAVVTGENVTIRRGPSTASGKVTIVNRGTRVTVLDREGSWYKLKFPKGSVGWVRGDLLKAVSATQVASSSPSKRSSTKVKKSRTAAKSAPNRRLVAANSSSKDIVERALGYRGVRYSYGSASRSATDCSGLTTQVYKAAGVALPRTSAQQSKVGQAVKKDTLKKGDLVFFKTNRGTRINHVGIYVGEGKFVHASSAGGKVKVDSLADGYYDRRYAGARRVAETKAAAPKPAAPKQAVEKVEPKKEEAPPKLDERADPPKSEG